MNVFSHVLFDFENICNFTSTNFIDLKKIKIDSTNNQFVHHPNVNSG